MALAAALAAAELLLGLNAFFGRGRLDPAPFLLVRPWLLLAAAFVAARWEWRARAGLYALFILLAASAGMALLAALGADAYWAGALRGIGLGLAVAVPADLAIQAGRRWRSRLGGLAAAALFGLLLLLLALGQARFGRSAAPPSAAGPPLLVMTSLPIVWGEGGAFDPSSRPAGAYRLLGEEFAVRPVDALDADSLGAGKLLLLAHPRWLDPAELVALDSWVRSGGRALILADPLLAWPSELPPGDVRRPPPTSLLGPLLAHWGLALDPPESRDRHGPPPATLAFHGARKLVMEAPGRFRPTGAACAVGPQPWIARCRIGKGSATLLADADLLRDDLWLPPSLEPEARTADNPLLLADLLDRLAGIERPRRHPPVAWIRDEAPKAPALAASLLPLALLAGLALLLRRL